MGKLYCVQIKNKYEITIDVVHIISESDRDVYDRMDVFLENCKLYNLKEYCSYLFRVVDVVDDLKIRIDEI